jgi:hypothetical protein
MPVPHWLQRILAHYEVPYEIVHHCPAQSAARLTQDIHVTGYSYA